MANTVCYPVQMEKLMLNISRPIWLLIAVQGQPHMVNWDSFSKVDSTVNGLLTKDTWYLK